MLGIQSIFQKTCPYACGTERHVWKLVLYFLGFYLFSPLGLSFLVLILRESERGENSGRDGWPWEWCSPSSTPTLCSPVPTLFKDCFLIYVEEGTLFIPPLRAHTSSLPLDGILFHENCKNLQQKLSAVFSSTLSLISIWWLQAQFFIKI